jgi:hypothetical protein
MRAGYRVVADGGIGLTDLAGVDNFSGPRRCSGTGCAGGGTTWARATRRRMFRTTTRCVTPRWKQPRRGVAPTTPPSGTKRGSDTRSSRPSRHDARRREPFVGPDRSWPAREQQHQQHDGSSNGISNHSTRNHRFNTVHATAPVMPPAPDAVASSSPRVAAAGGLARRPQRMPHSQTPQQVVRSFISSA